MPRIFMKNSIPNEMTIRKELDGKYSYIRIDGDILWIFFNTEMERQVASSLLLKNQINHDLEIIK